MDKISGKNLLSRWPFRKWKGNNTEKTKKVTEVLRGRARTIYPNGDHCRKFDVNPVKGSKVLSGHFICAVHENQLRSSSLFFGTMIGTGIYRSWFLSTEAISWNWAEKNISLYFFWPSVYIEVISKRSTETCRERGGNQIYFYLHPNWCWKRMVSVPSRASSVRNTSFFFLFHVPFRNN